MIDFQPGTAANWISAIVAALALIIAIRGNNRKEVEARNEQIDKKISEVKTHAFRLEERVQKIETEINHLPDKDTTHRLELALAKVEGQMATMNEAIKPIAAISNRFQEYLLHEATEKKRNAE